MSDQEFPLPPATFEFLVLSLKTQTEMHLGLLHFGEENERPEPDFPIARHTIDMLAMLQEKTRGNLSMEEQRLMENALTELRFRFVQAMEQHQKKATQPEAPAADAESRRTGRRLDGRSCQDHRARFGTSVGIPTIGCHCAVCTSDDPRDNRLRPSISFNYGGHGILIDTTPDFRQQALRAQIPRVDAILFTHSHADHIMGLDDVRPFNFKQGGEIPIYGSAGAPGKYLPLFPLHFRRTQERVVRGPRLTPHTFDGAPIDLFGLQFLPIRLCHGKGTVYGFRFGRAAYLTDHSDIPEESMLQLCGLDVLFLDALRHRPHPTHSTVRTIARIGRKTGAQACFLHAHLPRSRAWLDGRKAAAACPSGL